MNDRQVRATRCQVFGVTLGNALEFYDFLVFSFFAVQIGHSFFPDSNPSASLLAALATFGAGFLTRPLGAVVLGQLGDRIGRKPMLLVSFAMIGGASFGLALVPSYAAIGMAAPILVILLRLVQGFALGGEVGSSTAFLVESSPPLRRGFFVSLQYVGQAVATLIAGVVGVAVSSVMDDAALTAWGWRIALAFGVLILPIGLALRRDMPETMEQGAAAVAAPPFGSYARVMAVAFATFLSSTIVTYVLNYMTTYARTTLGLGSQVAFGATVAGGLAWVVASYLAGTLSDRYGRRALMIAPMAVGAMLVMPGFWLMVHYPGAATLWGVSAVLRFATMLASTAAMICVSESFPARVRSGSIAIVYAVAISIFGGSTQFVVAWLTQVTGDPLSPAWYMFVATVLGLVAMVFARESAPARTGSHATTD